MNRITVMPGGPDRRVPLENARRQYFEQGVPREVYDTDYIRRRLRDGDLVKVATTAAPASTTSPAAKSDAEAGLEAALARTANRDPLPAQPAPDKPDGDTKSGEMH